MQSFSSFCCSLSNILFFFFFFNDTATTEIYTLSYTTLFRSERGEQQAPQPTPEHLVDDRGHTKRSEEHTSELQSPCNLVCRLLLEKKKKKTYLPMFQQQKKQKTTT